jgi:hypothetical protein
VDVSRASCWDVGLTRYPHAHIGGYVRYPNGSPAIEAQALLISVDGSWWSTLQVGANGYLSYDSFDTGDTFLHLSKLGRYSKKLQNAVALAYSTFPVICKPFAKPLKGIRVASHSNESLQTHFVAIKSCCEGSGPERAFVPFSALDKYLVSHQKV